MTKQLIKISSVQTGKVVGGMYLALSLPVFALVFLIILATGKLNAGFGLALLLGPVFYGLVGFLGTAFTAWLYNVVASKTGGFEFTTAEVDAA